MPNRTLFVEEIGSNRFHNKKLNNIYVYLHFPCRCFTIRVDLTV